MSGNDDNDNDDDDDDDEDGPREFHDGSVVIAACDLLTRCDNDDGVDAGACAAGRRQQCLRMSGCNGNAPTEGLSIICGAIVAVNSRTAATAAGADQVIVVVVIAITIFLSLIDGVAFVESRGYHRG